MRGGRIANFIWDESAGGTVEFVAIIGPFLLITFFIFEIVIAVLWIGTAEKAAQLGARLAVVFNPAATGLPATYPLRSGGSYFYGEPCSQGACGTNGTGFDTVTCVGNSLAGCDSTALALDWCSLTPIDCIVKRMHDVFSLTQVQYVTITYAYAGLGFAGGPIIPSVTLKVSGVPYGAVITTLVGRFFSAGKGTSNLLATLPDISVTLTGEDLSSAGAS
jgi:hypothetical protein